MCSSDLILTDAHVKAREILTNYRSKLETVTRRLLDVEVMEGEELRRMLGMDGRPGVDEAVAAPPAL